MDKANTTTKSGLVLYNSTDMTQLILIVGNFSDKSIEAATFVL